MQRTKLKVFAAADDHEPPASAPATGKVDGMALSKGRKVWKVIVKVVYDQYRRVDPTTRSVLSGGAVLLSVIYIAISVPLRLGFFYDPHHATNSDWSPELTVFTTLDVLADIVGLIDFAVFVFEPHQRLAIYRKISVQSKWNVVKRHSGSSSPTSRSSSISRRHRSNATKWTVQNLKASVASETLPEAQSSAFTSLQETKRRSGQRQFRIGLDVIAMLPLELFALLTPTYKTVHILRLNKLLRIGRLRSCLRQLSKTLAHRHLVHTISRTGNATLVLAIASALILCHWCACGYMLIAHESCGVDISLCGEDYESSWAIRDRLQDATVLRKYARAMYWAARTIVSLGYDDVTPISNAETLFAIFAQFVGSMVSSIIIATFLFIFRHRNAAYVDFTAHVDNARAYMKSQNLPRALRRKVTAYFSYTWVTHQGLDSEASLHKLPRHFQSHILYYLKATPLQQIPFLAKESVEFINLLVLELINHVYTPNDVIAEPNINIRACFITRGSVQVISDSLGAKECTKGDYFSAGALLGTEYSNEYAIAKSFCELYALHQNKFNNVLKSFYRGHEAEVLEEMKTVFEKHEAQQRKMKKLLGTSDKNRRGSSFRAAIFHLGKKEGNNRQSSATPWFHPTSTFRERWELLRFVLIIYVAFEVPYNIIFVSSFNTESPFISARVHGAGYALTTCAEIFFLLDLFLRSRVFSYLEERVMIIVEDPAMIFAAYKAQGFYLDLLASLPVIWIIDTVNVPWKEYFSMLRLIRLIRFRHFFDLTENVAETYSLSSRVQWIVSLFLGVALTIHFAACLWFEAAWIDAHNIDYGTLHSLNRHDCLEMAKMYHNCSWVLFDSYGQLGHVLPNIDPASPYTASFAFLRSIYWAVVALTSVGYGDILAYSTSETIFAAIWIFVGGVINFGVVGAMSTTISNLTSGQREHVERINTLNGSMAHWGISQKLQADIRRFYYSKYMQRAELYESQLLSHLPEQLCYQISTQSHSKAARQVPLFDSASVEFLNEVTGKFRNRLYQVGETMYLKGSLCHEFFIIKRGKVDAFSQPRRAPVRAFHDGDCFGVSEFLLLLPSPVTLIAMSPISASVMTRDLFENIRRKYADDVRDMKEIAGEEWHDDMMTLKNIEKNLEKAKLKPHALATSTLFFQREQGSHTIGTIHAPSLRDLRDMKRAFQSFWTMALTLFNIYNAWAIIFCISFASIITVNGLGEELLLLLSLSIASDVAFTTDIYLKLFYFGCGEEVGMDNLITREEMNRCYFKSKEFKLDLLGIVPINWIFYNNVRAAEICRLTRLVRCRVLWTQLDEVIVQIQQRFPSRSVAPYLSPVKLLIFFLLGAHFTGCVFYWISEQECSNRSNCWMNQDTFILENKFSVLWLYMRSIYWAMTTLTLVGSKDIVPRDTLGTLWATLTCICCTFFMGYIIGEFSDLVINLNREEKEYKDRIVNFEHFAKENGLSTTIRGRVGAYLKMDFAHSHGHQMEDILKELNTNLRLQFAKEIYGTSLMKMPIAQYLSYSQIDNLALKLRSELFVAGDSILTEEAQGRQLCILRKGAAAVFWSESTTNVAVLLEGCVFGEVAFFLPSHRRLATVKAIQPCEVLHVSKQDWNELWTVSTGDFGEVQKHRDALHSIYQWLRNRLHRYRERCIAVACKAMRHLATQNMLVPVIGEPTADSKTVNTARPKKEQPQRLGTKKFASAMSVIRGGSKGTFASRNKSSSLFATPEAVMLKCKAKYMLQKLDVFQNQYDQAVNKALSETALWMQLRSFGRQDVGNVLKQRSSRSTTRNGAAKLAPSMRQTACEEEDSNADLYREMMSQVNPVSRYIRIHMTSQNLELLQKECWRRATYLAAVEFAVDKKLKEITDSMEAHNQQIAKVLAQKAPLRNGRRMSGLCQDSIQQLQASPVAHQRIISIDDSQALNRMSSIALVTNDLPPKDTLPTPRNMFSEATSVTNVLDSRKTNQDGANGTNELNSGSLEPFVQRRRSSLASLACQITRSRRQRLHRSKSLPLFDEKFFSLVKFDEEKHKRLANKVTGGLEAARHETVGINFEVLQQCQRPQFSKLLNLYHIYRNWRQKVGVSMSSKTSGHSTSRSQSRDSKRNLAVQQNLPDSKVLPVGDSKPLSKSGSARAMIKAQASKLHLLAKRKKSDRLLLGFQRMILNMSKMWEAFMLIISCYWVTGYPFRVCFDNDLQVRGSDALSPWIWCEYMMDLACFVDVGYKLHLHSNERHVQINTTPLLHRSSKYRRFIARVSSVIYPSFWYDLAALFPFDLAILAIYVPSAYERRYLSFLRLNKLLYVARIDSLSESLFQFFVYDVKLPITEATLRFIRSVIKYNVMIHLIACIWYAASDSAFKYYDKSWLSSSGLLILPPGFFTINLDVAGLRAVSLSRKYLRSLLVSYESVSMVYYGDITSLNVVETAVEMGFILVGIYVYGSLIGAQSEWLDIFMRQRASFEERIAAIQHYLVQHNVPDKMQQHIKNYYARIWNRQQGDEKLSATEFISPVLREDVVYTMRRTLAWRVTLFRSLEYYFLRSLLLKLHYVVCSDGEEIVAQGDVMRVMYFISSGRVIVRHEKSEQVKESGAHFGELPLLYGIPWQETCTALSVCDLFRLDHEDYEQLLQSYPNHRRMNKVDWIMPVAPSSPFVPTMRHAVDILMPHIKAGLSRRVDSLQNSPSSRRSSIDIATMVEDQIPHTYIYHSAMFLLSELNSLSVLEAKEIISSAKACAARYLLKDTDLSIPEDGTIEPGNTIIQTFCLLLDPSNFSKRLSGRSPRSIPRITSSGRSYGRMHG